MSKSILKCVSIVAFALASIVAAGLVVSCSNPLFDKAKGLQSREVSPVISLSLADGTVLKSGSVISFADTSYTGTAIVTITIENKGRSDLTIPAGQVALTPSSGTETGILDITTQPASTIKVDGKTSIAVCLNGTSAGIKVGKLQISSNDVSQPTVELVLRGTVLPEGGLAQPESFTVNNVSGTPDQYTKLALSWSAVSGSSRYKVWRDDSANGNFTTLVTDYVPSTNTGTINWIDSTVKPGSSNYYKIQAVSTSGLTSSRSGFASVGKVMGGIAISSFTVADLPIANESTGIPSVTVLPPTASIKNFKWVSDNLAVATVDAATGVVTAKAAGVAHISATTLDNTGIVASCPVYVLVPPVITESGAGSSRTVTITANPLNASMPNLKIYYATGGYPATTITNANNSSDSTEYTGPLRVCGNGVALPVSALVAIGNGSSIVANLTTSPISYGDLPLAAVLPSPSTSDWVSGVSSNKGGFVTDGRKLYCAYHVGTAQSGLWSATIPSGTVSQNTLGTTAAVPSSITTDGLNIYMAAGLNIYKIELASNKTTLLTSGFAWKGITTDGTYLYGYGSSASSVPVQRVLIASPSNISTIRNVSWPVNSPNCLYLHGNTLYTYEVSAQQIIAYDKTTGNVSKTYPIPSTGLFGFAVAGSYLYYTNITEKKVYAVKLSDGTTSVIVSGLTNCTGITTDGNVLFFDDSVNFKIIDYK